MRESLYTTLSLLLINLIFGVQPVKAQAGATSLRVGIPIERTLAAGQSHTYNISLEQDQFMRLVVDQRAIDVAIHVFSPAARQPRDYDSPNRANGPEKLT